MNKEEKKEDLKDEVIGEVIETGIDAGFDTSDVIEGVSGIEDISSGLIDIIGEIISGIAS